MKQRLLVGTRKGLFVLHHEADDWRIARRAFVGQNVSMTLGDSRDGALYVALDHGHFGTKLHRSDDGGDSWNEVGVPIFPAFGERDRERQAAAGEIGARRDFTKLHEIWELVEGGTDRLGVIWAGTIPGGLFRSSDRGESWELIRPLWDRDERWGWFGGGKDSPGIHSIVVDPRDSRRITVAISCGGVWHTEDDGATWETRATGMRAEYMPPESAYDPNVQDPHRLVACRAAPDRWWVQHHNGIFRTDDAGRSWHEMAAVSPSAFGFAVAVHPDQPDTAWFVPAVKDECRVPTDGRLVVTRTRDGGASFESLHRGLPERDAWDIVFRHSLAVDDSGSSLAFGSTTGGLWYSYDGGDQWNQVPVRLPPIHVVRFG